MTSFPSGARSGWPPKKAMAEGRLKMLTPLRREACIHAEAAASSSAMADGEPLRPRVDQVVVTTGFRPDLSFLSELRDRGRSDCGSSAGAGSADRSEPSFLRDRPPHGVDELAHPEKDFYIVGSKSYGRAPTFLMKTGYEQVRSVVAEIAGDHAPPRDGWNSSFPKRGCARSMSVAPRRDAAEVPRPRGGRLLCRRCGGERPGNPDAAAVLRNRRARS